MDLGLQDKVAIVAASSKGLGKASAIQLAREGAKVIMCSRDAERIAAAAAEARAEAIAYENGGEAIGIVADVTKSDAIQHVVDEALNRYGRIDILVNNAGGPPGGLFESFSADDFRNAIELNLMSALMFSQAVVPQMKAQGGGAIVNVTSISVKQPLDGLILSNTARAGTTGLAKSLANELGPHNIRVNCVAPGPTRTGRVLDLAQARAEREGITVEEAVNRDWQGIPLGRLGEPQEFANVVTFLASPAASYVTGITVQVDGGLFRGLM